MSDQSHVSDSGDSAGAALGEAAGRPGEPVAAVASAPVDESVGEPAEEDTIGGDADVPDQGDPTENALAEGIIIRDFAFPEGDPRHGGHYPKEEYENEDEPIKVRAMFDYAGETSNELSFKAGDIILVTESCDNGWLAAQLGDQRGYVPEGFVERIH